MEFPYKWRFVARKVFELRTIGLEKTRHGRPEDNSRDLQCFIAGNERHHHDSMMLAGSQKASPQGLRPFLDQLISTLIMSSVTKAIAILPKSSNP